VVPRRAVRGRCGARVIDSARYQWDEGRRRLEAEAREPARYHELIALVEVVTDELRRRIGETFTIAELAEAYDGAEDWVREAIVRETPPRGRAGVRDAALVQDAAFARYSVGATDYRP
jgi:hypothetical protein